MGKVRLDKKAQINKVISYYAIFKTIIGVI